MSHDHAPLLKLDTFYRIDQEALTVHPMHLLTLVGELGCALRFNPGGDDPMAPSQPPEQWEVYDVDTGGSAYLVGTGPTPVQALMDAAINLLGFDQEADEFGFDREAVTPGHLEALRKAHNAIGELLANDLRQRGGEA